VPVATKSRYKGSWKDGPVRYRSNILSDGELPMVEREINSQ